MKERLLYSKQSLNEMQYHSMHSWHRNIKLQQYKNKPTKEKKKHWIRVLNVYAFIDTMSTDRRKMILKFIVKKTSFHRWFM